jgi:WD40 repeat protein
LLWDVETGTPLGALLGGDEASVPAVAFHAVAFSPDGRRIVSGSFSDTTYGTLRLWDAETRAPLGAPLEGHGAPVSAVAFSPDGRRIVSGHGKKMLVSKLGQTPGPAFEDHEVELLHGSPDGDCVVSLPGILMLWDAETGAALGAPLKVHRASVSAVAFSPDGRYVVSGSSDKMLRLWDAETGALLGASLEGHGAPVNAVAFSPDGRYVVSASSDKTLNVWVAGATFGPAFEAHAASSTSLAFSPDGQRIASGTSENALDLWDASTGKPLALGKPEPEEGFGVRAVAYSPSGQRIVWGTGFAALRLSDSLTVKLLGVVRTRRGAGVYAIAYSPDGRRIAAGCADGSLHLRDAETGASVWTPIDGHGVGSNANDPIRMMSRINARMAQLVLRAEDKGMKSLAALPQVVVLQAKDALPEVEPSMPPSEPVQAYGVNAIAFSPDGRCIVSGSDDETLRLWDAETGAALGAPLKGHEGPVEAVAFSPDGERIVSGSHDRTLRLWDAKSGATIGKPLSGHGGKVIAVAFSPDGELIVSGSHDRTLRLWDAKIGTELCRFSGETSFWSMAMSGDTLAAGDAIGRVHILDTIPDATAKVAWLERFESEGRTHEVKPKTRRKLYWLWRLLGIAK